MNQTLRQRIFPNQSIKLRPPSPHARHQHNCSCSMCNAYEHKRQLEMLRVQQQTCRKRIVSQLQQINPIFSYCNCNSDHYEWLLSRLLLPTHKIIHKGIEIFIPQTVFFKDGQPTALYMNKQIHDSRIKKTKKHQINQTYIQKILNQRRRKYRDQVQILTGQKVIQKKKSFSLKKQQKIDTKDAAVIQFIDGSQQLITQNQLINLMLKRKQDSIWKKIIMLKNFVTSKQVAKRAFKLEFLQGKQAYPELLSRAKLLMKVYGGNIIKDEKQYISDEDQIKFSQELLKKSLKIFAEYVLYKIVAYIEYFYDEKIQSIECSLLVNQFSRVYLTDVFKLKVRELVKYQWTQESYRQKLDAEENKLLDSEVGNWENNPEVRDRAGQYAELMLTKYQAEKKRHGLTLDPEDTSQQTANNKFFAQLYPHVQKDLSQLLKNDLNMTLTEFKQKYLGHIRQKKPVFKPFSSNFVRTLHDLTPRVRFSEGKDMGYNTIDVQKNLSKTFRTRIVQSKIYNPSRGKGNLSAIDRFC